MDSQGTGWLLWCLDLLIDSVQWLLGVRVVARVFELVARFC